MKRNVGSFDRLIRIALGLAALSVAVTGHSNWGYLGLVPLATGLTGWCPPYSLLGISTCRKCSDSGPAASCGCGTRT